MSRWAVRRAAVFLLLVLVLTAGTGMRPAEAYWNASSSAAGSGSAAVSSLSQPAVPTVALSAGTTVSVSWTTTGFRGGPNATGYTVHRYDGQGASNDPGNGCAGTLQAVSCSETSVPDGLWTYTVTARYGSWSGPESARSTAIRVDTVAPTAVLGLVGGAGAVALSGATAWFRGAVAGSVQVSDSVVDGGSGPASSTSGSVGSTPGWSHTPSTVTTPAGGPYVSNPYSWSAGATAGPSVTFTGADASGNRTDTALAFTNDGDAPTGGAISYGDGTTNSKSLAVSVQPVSDAGSGVDTTTGAIQDSTAPLAADNATCGTFGGFATVRTAQPGTTSVSLTTGLCHRFRYVVADRVGNALVTTSTAVVTVPSYRAAVLGTSGLLRLYRLDETAGSTVADSLTGSSTGTVYNSPVRGVQGALAGDPDTAMRFDGSTSFVRIPREVAGDFSIEFWFRSAAGIDTGTTDQWYNHGPLLDADTSGTANDFGIALAGDGRVGAGVGNPDRTTYSAPGFNDDRWHYVVMTRTQSTGVVVLYVDGQRASSVTGSTAALTTTDEINLTRKASSTDKNAGALDEVALYSSVLTATQVKNHFDIGAP